MYYIRKNLNLPLQKFRKEDVVKNWLIKQLQLDCDVTNILTNLVYKPFIYFPPNLIEVQVDIPNQYSEHIMKCIRLLSLFSPDISYVKCDVPWILIYAETIDQINDYMVSLNKLIKTPPDHISINVYHPTVRFTIDQALDCNINRICAPFKLDVI